MTSSTDQQLPRRGGLLAGLAQPKILGLLLALLTFLVFWPVTSADFVGYDDPEYVTANPRVLQGLTWEGIWWASTTFHASNWHPLTWLSLMLDVQLIGPDPAALHITNLLLHLANTWLLFLLLWRLTGALWRSVFVAGLFALHPLHVESVAWVSERKDVLSTVFFLLTLLIYERYARAPGRRPFLLALGCFALGLLAKPMLVTVPFVLLLLDIWPLERLQSGRVGFDLARLWRLTFEKWPFFLLSAASSVLTLVAQHHGEAVRTLTVLPLTARLENAVISYARYLGKALWPADLSIFYSHPGSWPLEAVLPVAALLVGLSAAAVWLRMRAPYFLTGWFWFLGTLVPVIGLVQVGIQSMADRYTYVPLIGIFVLISWGAAALGMWNRMMRPLLVGAGVLALIGCAALTHRQAGYWKNDETLFTRALSVSPNSVLAHNNLADYLLRYERFGEAIPHYREVIRLNPSYAHAWLNLGVALGALGRHAEAIECLSKAVELDPRFTAGYVNLGDALVSAGRLPDALAAYRRALELEPTSLPALNNFAFALVRAGELDQAIAVYQRIVASHPDLPGAHLGLGTALARKGDIEQARHHLEQALRLKPEEPAILEQLRRLPETNEKRN